MSGWVGRCTIGVVACNVCRWGVFSQDVAPGHTHHDTWWQNCNMEILLSAIDPSVAYLDTSHHNFAKFTDQPSQMPLSLLQKQRPAQSHWLCCTFSSQSRDIIMTVHDLTRGLSTICMQDIAYKCRINWLYPEVWHIHFIAALIILTNIQFNFCLFDHLF